MRKTPFALLLLAAAPWLSACGHAQIVIIANPSLSVASVSKDDVRDVFTGASSNFRFGPHVNPVLMIRCPAHDEFLATYVGMMDGQFRSNWRGLLFAGQRTLPPSLDSEAAVVDYVLHHGTTVGYIHKTTPHPGVKELAVR
jgi:hypothetical protein